MYNLTTGGGNLLWFWVLMCDWSPRTPPHWYTRLSEKHWPIHILPISKIDPYHIFFFKFIHSYTFFWWTRYPIDIRLIWKWYPFIYLEAWKVYPFQSHICIYFRNGSYPPWTSQLPRRSVGITAGRLHNTKVMSAFWMTWWCWGWPNTFQINTVMARTHISRTRPAKYKIIFILCTDVTI